ncbi:MAG: hypothetical protein HY985_16250 [Magnetospirillum sp.]|nr:hypothetical protein [Magnetospirillum sp.]
MGSGAFIGEKLVIGDRSKVSAGSVVLRDMGEGELAVGNPARSRRMFA